MTNEQSAAYYGNLARVAAGFAISCDSDTEALAAYLYAVQAARYARYASLFTSPMKPATICPICHARTSTPATLPDGLTQVCQLCAVEDGAGPHKYADEARALASTFGAEWEALDDSDRWLIVRDCTTDGGVDDFAEYRRNIGPGNLAAYALTQRARFRRVDSVRN